MTRAFDIAIVGAGVSGCAAARELAPDHDVVVLEQGQPAGEASGLAGGVVAPATFYPETPRIATAAVDFFTSFDGTRAFAFEPHPWLDFVTERTESTFRERADRLADAGLTVSFLDRETLTEAYPEVDASGFTGALEYEDAGWVDPHSFTTALLEDATSRGAVVRPNTTVEDLRVESGTVVDVETDDGSVDTGHVLVAAGWRTRSFLADYVELPIRPWEFSIAVLEPPNPLNTAFPMGLSVDEGVYFRPERNGDLLVGDGERPAQNPERQCNGVSADETFRESVAAFVPDVLPGLADAELVTHWTGVEGVTPDSRPIVDAPGPDGLLVAQASAIGIMTAPPIAQTVRALVTGEETTFPRDRFALNRFELRTPDFEIEGMLRDTER